MKYVNSPFLRIPFHVLEKKVSVSLKKVSVSLAEHKRVRIPFHVNVLQEKCRYTFIGNFKVF